MFSLIQFSVSLSVDSLFITCHNLSTASTISLPQHQQQTINSELSESLSYIKRHRLKYIQYQVMPTYKVNFRRLHLSICNVSTRKTQFFRIHSNIHTWKGNWFQFFEHLFQYSWQFRRLLMSESFFFSKFSVLNRMRWLSLWLLNYKTCCQFFHVLHMHFIVLFLC